MLKTEKYIYNFTHTIIVIDVYWCNFSETNFSSTRWVWQVGIKYFCALHIDIIESNNAYIL